MEQYWMPKELDFENLRFCLDNYPIDSLRIGDCGVHGITKINEKLNRRILDFRLENGLDILIDNGVVFHFDLRDYDKGFSLAYERFFEDGSMYVQRGIPDNPDNEGLPKPRRSFFRIALDSNEMEIFFGGRIPIKFHSWWHKPYWKYWTVDKSDKL